MCKPYKYPRFVANIDADGKLKKADLALTRDKATVAGLIKANVAMDSLAKLVFSGKIDLTGWGGAAFTPGDRYFLNTAGTISTTPPSATGNYVVLVGEALDTTTLALNIDVPVLLS